MVGMIGVRVDSRSYGKLTQKKARHSKFRELSLPDFHESMFEAGRQYCEADPANYDTMRSLYISYVASEIKSPNDREGRSPFHCSRQAVDLRFDNTKALNLKFSNINLQEQLVAFAEKPHQFALRCAIYVLAGLRMVNGNAAPLLSSGGYST